MPKAKKSDTAAVHVNSVQDVNLADIDVPEDRARAFDPDEAAALAPIIKAIGLQHPIRVRAVGNRFRLVSGLRRLEAARLLGWQVIPLTVSKAQSDDEARLEEVLENLARAELTKLDRCQHLFELKRAHERLYPETKNGGDRGNQHTGGRTQNLRSGSEAEEIFGFAAAAAEKIGMSRRSIEVAVKIWTDLTPESRKRCVGTWIADHQAGLKQLSEQSQGDQAKVLDLLFTTPPRATNVPDALTILTYGRVLSHQEKKIAAVNDTLSKLPPQVASTVAAAHVDSRLAELQKGIATLSKFFGGLKDDELDTVVAEHEDRIVASLQRRGRI